ncbi:MAG: DMT family transporter [Oscillospiraceae bacterium]|nr:DMT family transporter [Oscillospiraceae bacterium]MBQ5749502.1 DMT family transporter [Oscillospiraceae bacterium]
MVTLTLLIAGLLQGVMISLNGPLGEFYSPFGVSFFVHGIALVLLLGYLLLIRRQKIRFRGAPWYVYLIGAMGLSIVAATSMTVGRIGATAMLALSTAGDLVGARIIDSFGLFGMNKVKFTWHQLPGYVLIVLGVVLVVLA